MNTIKSIKFGELPSADLVVDAVYEGGSKGNATDEPLSKLLKVSNQGGFRYIGNLAQGSLRLATLYSSMDDVDWPDLLDHETGVFYYYGDNKKPGHELHDTQRKGNILLRWLFDQAHQIKDGRKSVPPVFIFTKAGKGRDVVFRGIAVPGAESIPLTEDLVAVWKSFEGNRFQNYRAIFTILNVSHVSRKWINDIIAGESITENCPVAWKNWVLGGVAEPLKASRTLDYRNKKEQLPSNDHESLMLDAIRKYFKKDPYKFEQFAAELLKIAENNITKIEVTRPYKDGGRDAIGEYRLGIGKDRIILDFAVEAKCYGNDNSVGVKETSRLISRLRYRQFGLLVTTSYVAEQAYREIREDKHPIIIISGGDITKILIENGINTVGLLERFLATFNAR